MKGFYGCGDLDLYCKVRRMRKPLVVYFLILGLVGCFSLYAGD